MKTKHLLALLLLVLFPLPLTADNRLPAIIGDNMVLQQQADVLLWGEASPRCNITLEPSWSQNVYTTRTDDDGNWKITLPTIAAGGPYEIAITAGKDTRTLKNVLLGEVWLCGGQSNMDVSFRGLANQPTTAGGVGQSRRLNRPKRSAPSASSSAACSTSGRRCPSA